MGGFVEENWTVKLMRFSRGKSEIGEKGGGRYTRGRRGTMRFKLAEADGRVGKRG